MSQKRSPQPEKNQLTGGDSFRLLFSSHPIPMLLVDLETLAFLDVNDAALKKYGYTRDEFLKFNLRDIHASDRSGEQRHQLKNGEIIDMEVTSHPFEFEDQKMTLMMAQDITRRKQAEEASLESKLTAERYLNIAAEIIVSLDNEGNITHLNESGYQLLGYKTGLIGKNWFDTCIPKEEREEVRGFFKMLRRDEVQNMESRENNVITSNGDKKTVLWHNTILRDADDRFIGTLSSGDDITNRIEMEKTLRIALAKYKTLFEHFPLGVTIADGAGNILETNPAATKLLAVPRDEHTQRSIDGAEWHIIRPDGTPMPPEEYASVQALKQNGLIENVEMGIFKPDHSTTWISVSAVPIPLEGQGVVITYSDITARKKTEDLLKARLRISLFSESHTLDELLQKTLDEAEVLTSSKIGFAHFVQANQRMLELQMWSTNTIKNMCSAEGKGEHYSVDKAGVWADCVYTRAPIIHNDYANLPHRKGLPEGHAPVIRELVVPIIRNEVIVAIFGVGNKPYNYNNDDVDTVLELANLAWDIIQRKRVEEALKVSEKKYRMLHESMMDGFVRVDMDGTILDCNHHYMDMLGYSKDEVVSLNYVDITPQKWHAIETDIVENQILKRGYSDIYEKEYIRKDGTTFPAELHTVLMRDEHGKPVGMWAIVRDITERKRAEKEVETANIELKASLVREKEMAHTDMLTGVNNRRNLYELAVHELDIAIRYHQPLSLIMFDLDHFKKVNDTFGHIVGDQILVQVTQSAVMELRSADSIGRYGGEEFVVLLPMTNAQQAFILAERIRERVAQSRMPTPIGDAFVTLSIGIVEMTQTTGQDETFDDLIRCADRAMYAAKQSGRNRSIIFNSDETEIT